MFTGLIRDVGRVKTREDRGDTRLAITTALDPSALGEGASIACNGICLTVVESGPGWFAVTASEETRRSSTLGAWREGDPVNLEPALRLGDALDGHMVAGHVDGTAEILEKRPEGDSMRWRFRCPSPLARFLAPKGSVTLDGVSLTVNEVDGPVFGVNIIPHTSQNTRFGHELPVGALVNIEVDLVARYVARLLEAREES